jgi:hypothetical protein
MKQVFRMFQDMTITMAFSQTRAKFFIPIPIGLQLTPKDFYIERGELVLDCLVSRKKVDSVAGDLGKSQGTNGIPS